MGFPCSMTGLPAAEALCQRAQLPVVQPLIERGAEIRADKPAAKKKKDAPADQLIKAAADLKALESGRRAKADLPVPHKCRPTSTGVKVCE